MLLTTPEASEPHASTFQLSMTIVLPRRRKVTFLRAHMTDNIFHEYNVCLYFSCHIKICMRVEQVFLSKRHLTDGEARPPVRLHIGCCLRSPLRSPTLAIPNAATKCVQSGSGMPTADKRLLAAFHETWNVFLVPSGVTHPLIPSAHPVSMP